MKEESTGNKLVTFGQAALRNQNTFAPAAKVSSPSARCRSDIRQITSGPSQRASGMFLKTACPRLQDSSFFFSQPVGAMNTNNRARRKAVEKQRCLSDVRSEFAVFRTRLTPSEDYLFSAEMAGGENELSVYETGQSILEIIIALGVLLISISAAVLVLFSAQFLAVDTELSQDALYIAREALEEARAKAQQNFDGLTSSSSTQEGFSRETIVETVDADTKKVTSKVSWETDPLRQQKITLVTYVTDWRNVTPPPDPGDAGGGGTTGNWCAPQTLGSIDLGPGNSATDLDVINKIVYMTAEASAAAKPDFFVIDATNGQSPVIRSSLNTGPSLNSIDASGNYAYVANNSTTAQLQIIDVTNSSSPVLAVSFQLPGVSGAGAIGRSIFYTPSKVYIGTKTASGPEFHIIDVSNPSNPTALGSREIATDINDIYVTGNTAYLVTPDEGGEIKILNVSDPANITQLGSLDLPGDLADEDGKSIYAVANQLYAGRLKGGNHTNHHEFHIVNVSNPSAPLNLGSKDLAADVNDVTVRDNLAFLATSDSNAELQIWNVSNPANITLCATFNFPQSGTGIDYENNLVYMSVRSNDALRIITSSP